MPIIKRTSLPPLKPVSAPRDTFPFQAPGEALTIIATRLRNGISDAEWRKDFAEAKRLDAEYARVMERIAAGELYEVNF